MLVKSAKFTYVSESALSYTTRGGENGFGLAILLLRLDSLVRYYNKSIRFCSLFSTHLGT